MRSRSRPATDKEHDSRHRARRRTPDCRHENNCRDTLSDAPRAPIAQRPPSSAMSPPSTPSSMPGSIRTQATTATIQRCTTAAWRGRSGAIDALLAAGADTHARQLLRGHPPRHRCQRTPSRSRPGSRRLERLTSACLSRCRFPPAHTWTTFRDQMPCGRDTAPPVPSSDVRGREETGGFQRSATYAHARAVPRGD